jgi:hypothetical protein
MKQLIVILVTLVGGCSGRALLPPSDAGPGPGPGPIPVGGRLDLSVPRDASSPACAPSSERQFVSWHIALPGTRSEFAIDLNGDGKLDNALGNIIDALQAQAFDPQTTLNQVNQAGQGLILFGELADGSFQNTDCAVTRFANALAQPNPDFGGSGQFAVDPALPSSVFPGTLAGGDFTSTPPPSQAVNPVEVVLELPLLGPGLVRLPLTGASLRYNGSDSVLDSVTLNGAIRDSDLQSTVIPGLAAQLTQVVSATPCDTICQQNEQIFDLGGCTNADGTAARARDHRIDVCEVADNPIIKNVLAPDVQLFDAAGAYHPNPQNTHKDSLSVGVGITAVSARF